MKTWTRLNEARPPKNGKYLVIIGKGENRFIDIAYFALNLEAVDDWAFNGLKRSGFYNYESDGYYEVSRVKYWQPLPKMPEEEDDV